MRLQDSINADISGDSDCTRCTDGHVLDGFRAGSVLKISVVSTGSLGGVVAASRAKLSIVCTAARIARCTGEDGDIIHCSEEPMTIHVMVLDQRRRIA